MLRKETGTWLSGFAATGYPSVAAITPESRARDEHPADCLESARLLYYRQRPHACLRADVSAPAKTGLRDRLEVRHGRCLKSFSPIPAFDEDRGIHAAAWGSAGNLFPPTPKHLSATKAIFRKNPPGLLLGGGLFLRRKSHHVVSSLRSLQTEIQGSVLLPPSRGTLDTLRGASGVDSKTGAAIQRPVAPPGSFRIAR